MENVGFEVTSDDTEPDPPVELLKELDVVVAGMDIDDAFALAGWPKESVDGAADDGAAANDEAAAEPILNDRAGVEEGADVLAAKAFLFGSPRILRYECGVVRMEKEQNTVSLSLSLTLSRRLIRERRPIPSLR